MAEGQQPPRRLRLSRETLRSLEPSPAEAEGIRGAQNIPSLGGEGDTCDSLCNCGIIGKVWGATHYSWGCIMDLVIDNREDTIQRIHIEGRPNAAFRRFVESQVPDLDLSEKNMGRPPE